MADAEQMVRELQDFYRGYIEAFNREDIDQYTQCFDYPYAWVSGERGLTACSSESDNQTFVSQMMIGLKGRGWLRSQTDRLQAWPMAENLAMIMADATRFKGDGSILERVRASYTLRRRDGRWRIVTLSEIKAPFLGPGNVSR